MSHTLTASRGTGRSPSRGVRIGGALLATVVAFAVARVITMRGTDEPAQTVRPFDPAAEMARLEQRVAADPDDGEAWQHLAPYYLDRAAGSRPA